MPLALHAYQEHGAQWLAQRKRGGLFDRPRVGKTAQLIRAMDLLGHSRGIIVVPAVARENWRREFRRFELQTRKVAKGSTIHDFVAWANGHFDVLVTSYEMMVRWAPYLHDRCEPLHFVHFDEGHMMKNPESKRTETLLGPRSDGAGGAMMWGEYSWWLTGTPSPNDPLDIYTWLRHTGVMPLGKDAFSRRYFNSRPKTYGTAQAPKMDMLAELRALIANNSLCRTLEEVRPDLPPMYCTTWVIDGDAQPVRDLLMQHPGLDDTIKTTLESGQSMKMLDAPYMATLRRLIGEAKAAPYAHALLGELEGGLDKIVVFGHHSNVLRSVHDVLVKHGMRGGMIVGDTSEKERTAIQDAFAADPRFRFVICNIRAAGVAIDLSTSAALDMLEADWAPWMNYQALMRIQGQRQTRQTTVRFVTLANSFDETINEIIAGKTRDLGGLDTGATPGLEVMLG